MRILLAIMLSFFMTSCTAKSYNPEAQVDIRASTDDQAKVIAATKAFGDRNGFKVVAEDDLIRDGRRIPQLDLQRKDGVMVTMDNFMHADALQVFFFAKKPTADWRSVKKAWLHEVHAALNGRGEIVEVPVGPSPEPP